MVFYFKSYLAVPIIRGLYWPYFKMETEADIKGKELMLDAKINPQGMLSIYNKLLKEELNLDENKKNNSSSRGM